MPFALFVAAVIAALMLASYFASASRAPSESQLVAAARRARARAQALADALGAALERDPDVPSTWLVRLSTDRGDATLRMGTAALWGTLLRARFLDWMNLRAAGDPALAEGVVVRPPIYTVDDWRDGAPGEAVTHTTPSGVLLVIERPEGVEFDASGVLAWVEGFPTGVRLVRLDRERVELRAEGPFVADPVRAANALVALVRFEASRARGR